MNPRVMLKPAIEAMKEYRMPNYKDVGIELPDTGAIIAIIIYFIAKEPSISMTKLECYLILLDRLSVKMTQQHLFYWNLTKGGRIRNFKKIIEFMIEKQLISRRGKYQFDILKPVSKIKGFPAFLKGIVGLMSAIQNKYFHVTATALLSSL